MLHTTAALELAWTPIVRVGVVACSHRLCAVEGLGAVFKCPCQVHRCLERGGFMDVDVHLDGLQQARREQLDQLHRKAMNHSS